MGRPFESELSQLPMTYEWALAQCVRTLSQLMTDRSPRSAICIGSGGSYSAALLAAELLESSSGCTSVARTPLEIEGSGVPSNTSIWLISGSGRNVDIRRALRITARETNAPIVIVCAKANSPLEREARKLGIDSIYSFDSPAGKDGYLATNSLLATCVLLTRAAQRARSTVDSLPKNLSVLCADDYLSMPTGPSMSAAAGMMASAKCNIVLHGASGRVGAVDLESKFVEAAIAPVSITDYRNFAHGRHNWLNRYGRETHVIAFISGVEAKLASKTLDLLPNHVSRTIIILPDDLDCARLASIVSAFKLTQIAGLALGLDPGRPKIPDFGRKMYRIRSGLSLQKKERAPNPAVVRKLVAAGLQNDFSTEQCRAYTKAYAGFVQRLRRASLRALVLDYDGTLVTTEDRENPPISDVAAHLNRLLDAGLTIAIATGRGDSMREPLSEVIKPFHHKDVLIGYHNGAVVRYLNEPAPTNDCGSELGDSLRKFREAVLESTPFVSIDNIRTYAHQLSLRSSSQKLHGVWALVNELIAGNRLEQLRALKSGHSVDVFDGDVSKIAVVEELLARLGGGKRDQILCIGDSGGWPGNDLELLSFPLSLSVDDVSVSPHTCWNLLPTRMANVRGTLHYLEKVTVLDGQVRVVL